MEQEIALCSLAKSNDIGNCLIQMQKKKKKPVR